MASDSLPQPSMTAGSSGAVLGLADELG